jgi:hypothetical protein
MKFTEKLLRHPLPEQLKAVLEKFDGDFDASHLRKLDSLADSRGFTRYERYMLQRAYRRAKRDLALNEAMELVLNLNPRREIVVQPKGTTGITTAVWNGIVPPQQSMYEQQMDAVVNEQFNKSLRNMILGTRP